MRQLASGLGGVSAPVHWINMESTAWRYSVNPQHGGRQKLATLFCLYPRDIREQICQGLSLLFQ